LSTYRQTPRPEEEARIEPQKEEEQEHKSNTDCKSGEYDQKCLSKKDALEWTRTKHRDNQAHNYNSDKLKLVFD
jgi:hypothetical protein